MATQYTRRNTKFVDSVVAVGNFLEFSPERWEKDDWHVLIQSTPKVNHLYLYTEYYYRVYITSRGRTLKLKEQ